MRIEISGLTKAFGPVTAVDGLSCAVEPASVTGFLGPNGAGKSTTLRMLLGLVEPDAGTATIGGVRYADLTDPGRAVGAVLDASAFHPARSGRGHLLVYCAVHGFPARRADEVLDLVGLSAAGRRRAGGYSLGMRQRLALATALLGDPGVLVLDEPANGLDPEGIVWMRGLLRDMAAEGRTVLVSSHVLSEVQQLVDDVVIINRGRLVRQGDLADLVAGTAGVSVSTPDSEKLVAAIGEAGGRVDVVERGRLTVSGLDAAQVGRLARLADVELHELATRHSGLEDVFFALTGNGDR